jgi:hypothetical protein
MRARRTWIGVLPAVLAACALATAAVPTAPRAGVREQALPSALVYPICDRLLQQGGSTDVFTAGASSHVTQPIGAPGNIAACSLTVVPTYSNGQLELVQWDPATLAPDPTTIALRTRGFDMTALAYGRTRADFYPPVVTQSLANVAEPPRPTTAIDWFVGYNGHAMRFEANGSPDVPIALQLPAGGSARIPLPGAHPVLSHAVCGGDDALQSLRVLQSVMTTTGGISDTSCFEMIQRFRVPTRSRLHWVEVAFGVNGEPRYFDPLIAILDADGLTVPPVSLPPSLVEAPYTQYVYRPFWGSHYDFDHLITLEPGHDYWLLARVEHRYFLYSRVLTGGEGPDFTAAIGPFFQRTTLDGSWIAVPDRALCFRLIGEPIVPRPLPRGRLKESGLGEAGGTAPGHAPSNAATAAASVPRAGLEPGVLSLRVAPNPSKGAALVSWSGAAGGMRVDLYDAEGRRVAGAASLAGAEGRWLWAGTRDDGRLLPAGVYIVRASDGQGRVVSDRVVLIR